jgi:hypothetical protein
MDAVPGITSVIWAVAERFHINATSVMRMIIGRVTHQTVAVFQYVGLGAQRV